MTLSVPSTSSARDTIIPTNEDAAVAELKASLWSIFSPPSVPPDPTRSILTVSSAMTGSSNFGDKRSSSNTTSSSPPPKKPVRRARFENDPEIPVRRKACCRRCGREIARGHKRQAVARATTMSPSKPIPESIAETPNEAEEHAPPPPEPRSVSPPPPLIPLPQPVVNERQVKRVPPPPLSSPPTQPNHFRNVTSRPTSAEHPASTANAGSDLVERTRGIIATLSPLRVSPPPSISSRSSSLSRAQSSHVASPRIGRLSNLSQLILSPKPTRRALTIASGGIFQSRSTDDLGRRATIGRIPHSTTRSPLSNALDINTSPETVLDISPTVISRPEHDTSGSDDLPSPPKSAEPVFLELQITKSASVLCMSEYLESVFKHKSAVDALNQIHEQRTKDDLVSQGPPSPQNKASRTEGGHQANTERERDNSSPLDRNNSSSRGSGDSVRQSSPMMFTDDRDDHSIEYTSKRHRNWTGPPSRNSPRVVKPTLTWIPPASWAGPPEPLHSEDSQVSPRPGFSRSTTISSIDEALKPLTYLVHHQKTSSIDVCSTNDPAKASSEGCLPSSEGTVDGDDSSIDMAPRSTRVRKEGWQESAILDALPKLMELRLGMRRKRG